MEKDITLEYAAFLRSFKRNIDVSECFFIFRKIKKELWNEWNPPTFHGGIYSCESFGF